jgi:hypothetical protein
MTQGFKPKIKRINKRPGDALLGWGIVLAVLGFVLALLTAGYGGNLAVVLTLTVGGLLLVVISYLKRILIALESR